MSPQAVTVPPASSAPPSISVVVLTYNRIDSLRGLLTELDTLTYPGLEIVVVDNFSEVPAESLQPTFPV